jgi:PhoH-like ATPase
MQYSKEIFEQYDKVYICGWVLSELDKHKVSNSEEKKYLARRAGRDIEANRDKVFYLINECKFNLPSYFDIGSMDNKIISILNELYDSDSEVVALSNDLLFREKCNLLMIPCENFDSGGSEELNYKGYKEITLCDSELASFYSNKKNDFGLLINEYLLLKNNKGEIVDKYKWNGKEFNQIIIDSKKNKLDFTYTEKIKPRNIQQELAFDLFQNRNITCKVIFGKHGSGKDLIMATHALSMIKQGIYDRLIFVRNNYEVANSNKIGYLPGDQDGKLLPFAMPLADHVGGVDGLTKLIDDGIVVLQHLGFIRGRDIKKSLIYCSEAENMTKEHIQLLISRLSEGSALWLNGDFKQVDDNIFKRNSGLKQIINKLKGNELFGCVEFSITERSKTAQLADLLD